MSPPRPNRQIALAAAAAVLVAGAPGLATAADLRLLTPGGWASVPVTSSMRKAQYRLPKVKGDTEASELVVFYFGPEAGTVEANLDRWFGQFEQGDGRPTKDVAKVNKRSIAKMDVTIVRVGGTYSASMPGQPPMAGGGSVKKPNFMMLAAIVETPAGPYFLKAVGPQRSIQSAARGFDWLLATMKFNS